MNDSESAHPITKLGTNTQSRIRSTQILTSLSQLISELVQNSLDAGARHVEVGFDCEEWSCWVRDDGSGITREAFDSLVGIDSMTRYNTSKAYCPASLDHVSTFGFRGEALASAADMSCLEISSRTARSRECWSVILKGGVTLYHGPAIRWRRESPGTVVNVRDAFYNLPIRRKSHPSPSRTAELIRRDIEAFALVFPNVSFTMDNTHKAKEGIHGKGRIMAVPKTESTLAAFKHLFGKALVEHVDEVNEVAGDIELQGFLSLNGAHSKAYQYLYVNRHLMTSCDLHRIIDTKFAMSSFSKHALDEEGETGQRSTERRSPRKVEKRPVYVLNLTIPPQYVDNCLEPAKAIVQIQNGETVSKFIADVVDKFLVKNGFLSSNPNRRRSRDQTVSMPRKRCKVERDAGNEQESLPRTVSTKCINTDNSCRDTSSGDLIVHPADSSKCENHRIEETIWTDPSTGQTFMVDTRTGNSYPIHSRPSDALEDEAAYPQTRRTRGIAEQNTNDAATSKEVPEWIREALQTNTAYMLPEPRIPAITPSIPHTAEVHDRYHPASQGQSSSRSRRYTQHNSLQYLTSQDPLTSQLGQFDRQSLRNSTVLGQVDRKFIACVLQDHRDDDDQEGHALEGSHALVLIDQHAADERIRVERFLKELCRGFLNYERRLGMDGVQTRELSPPMLVLLTRPEASMLTMPDTRHAFERWGFLLGEVDVTQDEDADLWNSLTTPEGNDEGAQDDGYIQVPVRGVPEVVADKLLAGAELRNLFKGYLAKLESEGSPAVPSMEPRSTSDWDSAGVDGDHARGWQRAMRWCPQELIELVNSKACRGAIMFNDDLTLYQCTRLVQDLADTALPFQCAHGRPSLVPLANLEDESSHSQSRTLSSTSGALRFRNSRDIDWSSFDIA